MCCREVIVSIQIETDCVCRFISFTEQHKPYLIEILQLVWVKSAGRAVLLSTCPHLLNAEAWAQSQGKPYRTCGGKSGTRTGFPRSNSVFPGQYHSISVTHLHSSIYHRGCAVQTHSSSLGNCNKTQHVVFASRYLRTSKNLTLTKHISFQRDNQMNKNRSQYVGPYWLNVDESL